MQQICTDGIQDYARRGRKGDPLGIVQEVKVWPYEQMVSALKNEMQCSKEIGSKPEYLNYKYQFII